MDEIIIEEKKYVSSKQAAKITGYAKDYIGQLCREGRVPARLVGRSWYVLESAIQDHRFGNEEVEPKTDDKPKAAASSSEVLESSRYEASHNVDIFPPINRLREAAASEGGTPRASQSLHDSWGAWFEHVSEEILTPAAEMPVRQIENVSTAAISEEKEEVSIEEKTEAETEREARSVPIHVVSQPLPSKEILPMMDIREEKGEEQEPQSRGKVGSLEVRRRTVTTIRVIGVLIAIISVTLAVVGSGYLDRYTISDSQASVFSGVTIYNR